MTKGDKIRKAREDKHITQEELGTLCGTTKQTIFKYENGVITNIPFDRLELIAEILDVSPAYLMGWETEKSFPSNIIPMPDTYDVPLVGEIACGQPIPALEDAIDTAAVPGHIRANFALRCKGDSMINARIFDGDIVYIRQQEEVENGQIAAVRIGDEATLKRVYYNQQDGRLVLRACNPLYPDMIFEGESLNEIEVLGLAVAFTSAVRHE